MGGGYGGLGTYQWYIGRQVIYMERGTAELTSVCSDIQRQQQPNTHAHADDEDWAPGCRDTPAKIRWTLQRDKRKGQLHTRNNQEEEQSRGDVWIVCLVMEAVHPCGCNALPRFSGGKKKKEQTGIWNNPNIFTMQASFYRYKKIRVI